MHSKKICFLFFIFEERNQRLPVPVISGGNIVPFFELAGEIIGVRKTAFLCYLRDGIFGFLEQISRFGKTYLQQIVDRGISGDFFEHRQQCAGRHGGNFGNTADRPVFHIFVFQQADEFSQTAEGVRHGVLVPGIFS